MAELTNVVLEERQQTFLNWLLDPRSQSKSEDEDPNLYKGTLAEYSKKKRIGVSTLQEWKAETKFRQAWDEQIQRIAGGPERMQAFLRELTTIAIGGDPHARTADRITAIKLHLEAVGRVSPKTIVEIRDPRLEAAADEDLLARAAKHQKRIEQAAAASNVTELYPDGQSSND